VVPLAGCDPLGTAALVRAELEDGEERLQKASASQVGGPLYPPIHSLMMYPVALLPSWQAYRLAQVLSLVFALTAAWGIRLLSQGRIWWPVAVLAIVLFPSFSTTLNLAQNSIFMLALLIWGWVLLSRDWPVAGGIVWGLLAFKPTWAAAFFLAPLLTRRWRFCLAMLGTGLALALATLPFVGWHGWMDWLHIGREASWIYQVDDNWVFLSRDLFNIPRRWLMDFQVEPRDRHSTAATVIGWSLLATVVGVTALVAWRRQEQVRAFTGDGAAFLLLGSWLSCFHFMYYDVLLTALPVLLLLTEPRRYLQLRFLTITRGSDAQLSEDLIEYHRPAPASAWPGGVGGSQLVYRSVFVINSLTLSLLALFAISDLTLPLLDIAVSISAKGLQDGPVPLPLKFSTSHVGTPLNTFCLIALWAWCGWLTWSVKPTDGRPWA
jgi:hypothetical protein